MPVNNSSMTSLGTVNLLTAAAPLAIHSGDSVYHRVGNNIPWNPKLLDLHPTKRRQRCRAGIGDNESKGFSQHRRLENNLLIQIKLLKCTLASLQVGMSVP